MLLTDAERKTYFDILGGPIQGQVKSGSKQIRSTKVLLGEEGLRGGIIYLNTGYGSFPVEEFGTASIRKYSSARIPEILKST